MSEIVCIAEIIAKPEHVTKLIPIFEKMKILSKQEPGCIRYELHSSIENPLKFTFVDRFKDQAAFDSHCEMEYIKFYFDHEIPKFSEPVKFETYKEI